MTSADRRAFGYWSRAKLEILDRYLDAFLTASSGQAERIYIDAFAGSGHGVDRLTGEKFDGSARIAIEAAGSGRHRFTRLHFFELESRASELEAKLHTAYPGRDITVHPGDCNEKIPKALAELAEVRWAPTFAFVDPDGLEVAWPTLQALAEHKQGYRRAGSQKPPYKVEVWLLFPTQGLVRTLALDDAKLSSADEARATRLFGTDRWKAIYNLRRRDAISPATAKTEYVNLMRWRLENELGYTRTHMLELENMSGGTLYHMIFATDHRAGDQIMSNLYSRAAAEIPAMRREAIDRRRGQLSIELPAGVDPAPTYVHESPWEPPTVEVAE